MDELIDYNTNLATCCYCPPESWLGRFVKRSPNPIFQAHDAKRDGLPSVLPPIADDRERSVGNVLPPRPGDNERGV